VNGAPNDPGACAAVRSPATWRGAAPVGAAVGAGLARVSWRVLRGLPPGAADRWERKNHRGGTVTLLEGPALAAATAAAAAAVPGIPARVRAAGLVAVAGAGLLGAVDDLAERGNRKGLRGHLGALARGELTTGGLKVLGIGGTGLLAAALALPRTPGRAAARADQAGRVVRAGRADQAGRAVRAGRVFDVVTAGAVVAGSANLVNLLDLRPGRALKVVLATAPLLAGRRGGGLAATTAGAAAALLREDLGERAMLGDTGANASGAVLGAALVASVGRRTRLATLAALVGLTLASERWSFTEVIESTPGLRELDALGRCHPR
jgi:UDP-GlcNAc:undecaprenyl-phosphate GlcNAc-1-phosphate transferase